MSGKPRLWRCCYSAQDRTDAALPTAAFLLFSARATTSTAEAGPQVPKDSSECGPDTPLLCSRAGWAPLAPGDPHNMVQLYPSDAILAPKNKPQEWWSMEKKKKNHEQTRRRKMPGFDKCLLSVLSQFKAIIKFNLKKDKIEVFQ